MYSFWHQTQHVPIMLCSLTSRNLWFLGLLRFPWAQTTLGGCPRSRVYSDRAAGGRVWRGGGQPQICEAGSRVDRARCCICRSRSHVDRAYSRGRPGADGGLGNWLLLGRADWLRLGLQRDGWQKEGRGVRSVLTANSHTEELLSRLIKSLDKWFTKLQSSRDSTAQ